MTSKTFAVSLAVVSLFPQMSSAQQAPWYEPEAATGDPLVSLNRLGVGFEHAEADGHREKLFFSASMLLGAKTGRNDWSLGVELPFLMNDPAGGGSDEGVGDFKLRLTHSWLEDQGWLVASYLESEFDTAATDVQAIANQRNQLALGSGFIRNFGNGWAVGAALQYGWSLDAGTSTGSKSEWECRTGLRKTFCDVLRGNFSFR
jgi:hypothetical protein